MQPRSWCWLRERIDHGQWLRKRIFRWGWFGDPQHLMLFFRHFDRLRTSWAQKNRKWWFWCIPMSKPRVRNHTPFDFNCYENIGGGMVAPSHPLHPSPIAANMQEACPELLQSSWFQFSCINWHWRFPAPQWKCCVQRKARDTEWQRDTKRW